MAKLTADPYTRHSLLHIAEVWDGLAIERERPAIQRTDRKAG